VRLYSRKGDHTISHADYGQFTAGEDGGFDLPEDLGRQLARFPEWETDIDRQHRLGAEEVARRADPATLLGAVEQLVAAAQATQVAPPAPAPAPTGPKTTRARAKTAAAGK
jgi:hypothetical protein